MRPVFHIIIFAWPTTVPLHHTALYVFCRANTGIMGSNFTWPIDVCYVFPVFELFSVHRGLATSWSLIQGVLPSSKKMSRFLELVQGRGCTGTICTKIKCSIDTLNADCEIPQEAIRSLRAETWEQTDGLRWVSYYAFILCRGPSAGPIKLWSSKERKSSFYV